MTRIFHYYAQVKDFFPLTKKVLQEIYATKTYQLGPKAPTKLQDVFNLTSPRKNHELGASLQTDGIQLICRWEKDVQRTITVSTAKHEEYEKNKVEKAKFLALYEEQQRRPLREGEQKIDGRRVRTKIPSLQDKATALKSGLLDTSCGLFTYTAIESTIAKAALPTVVAIDPGHCNVWFASRRPLTEGEKWEPLTPISGGSHPC